MTSRFRANQVEPELWQVSERYQHKDEIFYNLAADIRLTSSGKWSTQLAEGFWWRKRDQDQTFPDQPTAEAAARAIAEWGDDSIEFLNDETQGRGTV